MAVKVGETAAAAVTVGTTVIAVANDSGMSDIHRIMRANVGSGGLASVPIVKCMLSSYIDCLVLNHNLIRAVVFGCCMDFNVMD